MATEFDRKYKGSGVAVTNAFNKYGRDNFKCEVLQWCTTQTQLNAAEDNCIKLYCTMYPNGYNLKGGGSHGKLCKKTRKKISESNKKKHVMSEDGRKRLSESRKGKTLSEETKKKISIAKSNPSETTRKKMSESAKGRVLSDETRKKLSEIRKGRIPWNKGKKCDNISQSHKGKTLSKEHCKKLSEAAKKRWAKILTNYDYQS